MKFTDRQRMAIQMLVNDGMKKGQVAKALNVIPDTVTRWFHDETFLKEYHKALNDRINMSAAMAIIRIESLMDSPDDRVALRAAQDIASRAGLDATVKQDIKMEGTMIVIDYGDKDE